MRNPTKLLFQRELHIRDGRTIRSVADAIALLREHEARPGVDARDEVLHHLERAHNEQEIQHAAEAFLVWARELDVLLPTHETTRPRA